MRTVYHYEIFHDFIEQGNSKSFTFLFDQNFFVKEKGKIL